MEKGNSVAGAADQAQQVRVGIDVSKEKIDVAFQPKKGKWRDKVFPNTRSGFEQLRAWLAALGISSAHVCMEATNVYWENLAEDLADHGFKVSVVNPFLIKRYAESIGVRSKTDRVDARVIAQFCSERTPEPWEPLSPAARQLRALVLRRMSLIDLRTQEQNRLGTVSTEQVQRSIQHVIGHLNQEIKDIEQQISDHIDGDPMLKQQRKLLDSIPGFGPVTTSAMLCQFGGELRFSKSSQAVAYAGLDVRRHESGTSVRANPGISRKGHGWFRGTLYMPAVTVATNSAWGRAFSERLKAAGKPSKVILTAIMRKMVALGYAVLRTGKPFDPAMHAA